MPSTKVIDLVSAIHKRVREHAASYETPAVLDDWSNELNKLHSAYNTAYCARNLVGSAPLLPKTLLGMVAGWVIGLAQRVLVWYTPQIRQFNEATTSTLNRICSLEDRQFRVCVAMAHRLENVERETRLLRAQAMAVEPDPPSCPLGTDQTAEAPLQPQRGLYTRSLIDAKDFYFQLQGRFQSTAHADRRQMEFYLSAIGVLDPKLPQGAWLDIGCGRGSWLRCTREGGFEATGVDSNPDAVRQCREDGFQIAESDALEFLRSTPDESFSLVSAFHVLEHLRFEYCLNLVYQIARTLKPDGILLIETPHPGNLLMATEQFWLDPTHHRPIPPPLMEFLFEYCGLGVIRRFEVNPREESEHLPFRELELANRLDALLYGPQDYAMMGRRNG